MLFQNSVTVRCIYRLQEVTGAGSPWAHTSQLGRCLETGGQPTGQTHPPSRQSGWGEGGRHSASRWPRTRAVAPSGPRPPASCWGRSRDLGSPERSVIFISVFTSIDTFEKKPSCPINSTYKTCDSKVILQHLTALNSLTGAAFALVSSRYFSQVKVWAS